jgi:GMP synthase (glutamine-hydrolysing)
MSILIIDYGGSTVHEIPVVLADLEISSRIIKPTDSFPHENYLGIILSGGPDHVYEPGSRKLPTWIDQTHLPIFAIFYGMQLMVDHFGGDVTPSLIRERGPTLINSLNWDPLLGDFSTRSTWMNHYDIVSKIPPNLEITSISENGFIASVNDRKRWWGVQFHPENSVGLDWGREIFKNFTKICINYTL